MASSSSPTVHSNHPSSYSVPSLSHLPLTLHIKLNHNNYPVWKAQALPYFRGQGVIGYLDGTISAPPQEIDATNPVTGAISKVPNPEYAQWIRQDSIILATINSSLTEEVLSQVMSYNTSREVWHALQQNFSSISRAKTVQIRTQLATARKGAMSAKDFFLSIKRMADDLALAGQPLKNEEILTYVLAGLGQEYDSLVSTITSRSDEVPLEELYSMLLFSEARINQHHDQIHVAASVNMATKSTPQYYAASRSAHSYRGRGNQFRSHSKGGRYTHRAPATSSSLVCQVCNKPGHHALKCYHRFDLNFQDQSQQRAPSAYLAARQHNPSPEWHPDTGATHHLTNEMSNIQLTQEDYTGHDQIQVANGAGLKITRSGKSTMSSPSKSFILNQILLVPEITKNLLSVHRFCRDNNVFFEFHDFFFLVKDYLGNVLHRGPLLNGLYSFSMSLANLRPQVFSSVRVSAKLWHQRLGHASLPVMNKAVSFPNSSNKMPICSHCQMAKSHALPFSHKHISASKPLELLYSDVWGPAPTISTTGARYYISFLDDSTKFLWLFPLKLKSDALPTFQKFQAAVERQFDAKIKSIQTDWGGEYRSFTQFLQNQGITHRVTCPYTHQQAGAIERRHRQIVEVGLALLPHSKLPQCFWEDAFLTAVFIINRLPTPVLQQKSPFEMVNRCKPDFEFLRVFGCACWPYLRPYNKHKMNFRSKSCIFLGYSIGHRGYKCLDASTGKIYVSRHVVFDENHFPFDSPSLVTVSPVTVSQNSESVTFPSRLIIPNTLPPSTANLLPIDHAPLSRGQSAIPHNAHSPVHIEPEPSSQPNCPISAEIEIPILNSHTHSQIQPTNNHPMTTRSKNNIHKPKIPPNSHTRYPLPKALMATVKQIEMEPTCFTEANKHAEWRAAMNTEMDALLHNETWTLIPSPPAANILGCKWVYRIKRKADGSVERFKARLVAKGFNQQEGVDFSETFCPVVKPTTVRMVLSIAVSRGWHLRQIDVQNAFLHGFIDEHVFMAQPPGFQHPQYPRHVCKLQKSIYGLRQAPRAWFSRLTEKMTTIGFVGSEADHSLYVHHSDSVLTYILIYVDDIILAGADLPFIHHVISLLKCEFPVKDLGQLNFFLGVEAIREPEGLYLTQRRYILDLLMRSKMDKSKPSTTPMSTNQQLSKSDGDKFDNPQLYRSIVGGLQYLSFTRPEIAFAIHKVSKYMHDPRVPHWVAVKRILRYLKSTISHALFIQPDSDLQLHSYSDADWATDQDDRRSVGAYCVYLGKNLVSWSCKQQPTVARSSTEAEYKALANAAAEVMWLTTLLSDLRISQPQPPTLWCDNIGATYLTSNPLFHARTKHIEIDFHFVRDQVINGQLLVRLISTKDQYADALTKPLPSPRFQLIRSNLRVNSLPLRLRGHVEDQVNQQTNEDN